MDFAKFLRTPFLQNACGRLLLIFTKSMKRTSEVVFWWNPGVDLHQDYWPEIYIQIADHIRRQVFWKSERLVLLYSLLTMWYISWRSFGFLNVIIYITTEIWGSPYNRAKIIFSLPCFSLWLYMFVQVYLFVGICLYVCISSQLFEPAQDKVTRALKQQL